MRLANSLRQSTRLRGIGLIICLIATSLPGCGKARFTPTPMPTSTPQPTPTAESSPTPRPDQVPGPTTISFSFELPELTYYMQLAYEFNQRYPNIMVTLQPWNWEPDGSGGYVGPDYTADVNVVFSFDPMNSAISLNSYIEQNPALNSSDFYPFAQELFSIGGDTWAIPTGVDFGVMYYDRVSFDQYRVSYPQVGWTRDDFLKTAVALSHPEEDIFGYGIGRASLDVFSFYEPYWFIFTHGGRIVDDWEEPTQLVLDDPLTLEALQWYADLIYKHNVAPTPEQAAVFGSSASQALVGPVDRGFANGNIGMMLGRFSERGGWVYYGGPGWFRSWGMTTIPKDAQAVTLAMAEGLAISAQAQYPEACLAWISFVSEKIPHRLAPARKSVVESAEYTQRVGSEAAAVTRTSFEYAWPIPYGYYLVVGDTFQEAFNALVSQGISAAEAMQIVLQATGSP